MIYEQKILDYSLHINNRIAASLQFNSVTSPTTRCLTLAVRGVLNMKWGDNARQYLNHATVSIIVTDI